MHRSSCVQRCPRPLAVQTSVQVAVRLRRQFEICNDSCVVSPLTLLWTALSRFYLLWIVGYYVWVRCFSLDGAGSFSLISWFILAH